MEKKRYCLEEREREERGREREGVRKKNDPGNSRKDWLMLKKNES